jgi:16S rRNA (cytosine967-C5)-methyltransferase
LPRALDVAALPGFDRGLVSVQDAAAQLAAEMLAAEPRMRVLDACAAPGGKTGHLLERAGGQLELIALDVDARRLERVEENLSRLGYHAQLLAADAAQTDRWWTGRPFDRILVDAPCSATGVIRRHPDIKLLRRRSDIPSLAGSQSRLLDALWPLLRQGGRLVYCTCSLLKTENEEVIAAFVGRHRDARVALPEATGAPWRVCGAGVQLLPCDADVDGFYYARLEKR